MEEIAAFLGNYPPFDQLPPTALQRIARSIQIEYFATNHDILTFGGTPSQFLYVVCKGHVDLIREGEGETQIFDSLGPGEAFGHPSLILGQPPIITVRAHTEVLAYLIPAALFHDLRAEFPPFANFFAASAIERLEFAVRSRRDSAAPTLFQTHLRDLVERDLVAISPDATVQEAAQLMSQEHVSCLLIDLPPYGVLDQDTGIFTDRDLRTRVVAAGIPYNTPVSKVMTTPIRTLPADSLVFEGLMAMLENRQHHMPITEHGRIVGIVTHMAILRHQSSSPVFLPSQLRRAQTMDDMRRYREKVVATVGSLLDAGARVSDIGRVVAVAHDALLQRLLRDAEATLGPPPVPYAWMVLGSEGRFEQTLRTDQDNALVYADDAPPEAESYFAKLADLIVGQLEVCGFPRCPGEIMASNPQWRQPLHVWKDYFSRWITVPEEEALLRIAIFFDFRRVYGELDVESALRPVILQARENRVFLARLARAGLRNHAPLTLFRQVALQRQGDQRHLIDLKHRGTAMVVDMARLFSLEAGCNATSTVARLRQSWPESSISEADAQTLISAFELISTLRLRNQQEQITRGEEVTNHVCYRQLSPINQRELKESLQVIAGVQRGLARIFQTNLIG
ncbi:CBS domain-containing protein [Oscillochloris trichoides DG-6]|uniref:CBS domain-containing protein n=1 Tax=Oscillochloris trichoides DG-6 TaxID=765420 RepID=E1IAM4_9CHLR|nr:DUF294 nucleotidyltransferase-like domain-containing protein [Oscillochloris trichoides]EFO81798.1 CBS domain-containing protein [Oscillochloris trichoides DG-6]